MSPCKKQLTILRNMELYVRKMLVLKIAQEQETLSRDIFSSKS